MEGDDTGCAYSAHLWGAGREMPVLEIIWDETSETVLVSSSFPRDSWYFVAFGQVFDKQGLKISKRKKQ